MLMATPGAMLDALFATLLYAIYAYGAMRTMLMPCLRAGCYASALFAAADVNPPLPAAFLPSMLSAAPFRCLIWRYIR